MSELVGQSVGQKDPYKASASDFPVSEVSEAHGQGADASGQKNQLVKYGDFQHSPRLAETGGSNSGSGVPVPVDRASQVASSFPISRNTGESSGSASSVSIAESVSLSEGYIRCSGGAQTRVKEVPEGKVSIPS